MTENNNNQEQETTAPEQTYEVLVGTRIVCQATSELSARNIAREQFREQYPDFSATTLGHVLKKDGEYLNLRVPESLTQLEAHHLLQWAIENADRERITWSELTELLSEPDNVYYERVRDTLENGGLDVEVFVSWAMEERPAMSYKYQATNKELEALADEAVEKYLGVYHDNATFSYEYYLDAGELAGIPSEIENAIDWDVVWDDALSHDITRIEISSGWNGHYFRAY